MVKRPRVNGKVKARLVKVQQQPSDLGNGLEVLTSGSVDVSVTVQSDREGILVVKCETNRVYNKKDE